MAIVPFHSQEGAFLRWFARFGAGCLRLMPAEEAHDLGMWLLSRGLMAVLPGVETEALSGMSLRVPSIGDLRHPIGLAAGFDKNARCPDAFRRMGFSFLELGTVTPKPQSGNAKPRMFRLADQQGLINRMGFNSDGIELVLKRLSHLAWDHDPVPLGINLGKNKATAPEAALSDYLDGLRSFETQGRYFVINVSSPNTEGLRHLADREFLRHLAGEVRHLLPRLWVKLDPDMPKARLQGLIEEMTTLGYQGVILCNTHRVEKPEMGGFSGQALSSLSQSRLEWAYEVHRGKLLMIASGGVFSGLDVMERLLRGASLVQIYSALVYRGPFAVFEILEELRCEMALRGITCLADVVGAYYS